ncbi:MAG: tetratricopeptide repeat protein [Thermoplasmata archaeon]|nr:tetratricopeptide repeat protein [Thermoplasmata archaeon]
MEELVLQQTELIGRDEKLFKLKDSLDNAIIGKGSMVFIAGEAGIGKTRLVSELKKDAETKGVNIIQGWCLSEILEPLMPIKTALREVGMLHLISGDPPPKVVSVYLISEAGMLISKAEREESGLDPDIFASMLQAVGNFVQDSLSMMDSGSIGCLNSLGYGEYSILLQSSGSLSMATVIKGMNNEFLIDDMKRVLREVGGRFDDWSGDVSSAVDIQPKITWFVNSGKYDGEFLVDDAKIRQENLFDNILLGIQRASMEKPTLLFLDDLQWSDHTTLNLVHYLARNTRDNNILILGTYRPEDIMESNDGRPHHLETAMQNMNREDLLDKIELSRLGLEDTSMIINSTLGKTSFDDKFLNRIYKETGGTPLFILEVIKLLMEDRSIEQDKEGAWELKTELEELDVPSKVYDVIKRRLDRLIKEQRGVLECASVVGEKFGSDVVACTIGLNKFQLLRNLSEIEKTHKLIRSYERKYVFDHAKIREVLYNGIMGELKQEYHRIVADTIAELHDGNENEIVNELAYHYFEARDKRAGEYIVKAGDMAKERYANEEAIWFYDRAIKLLDNEAKSEVLEKLASIQVLIGEYDMAIVSYEKAEESTEDNEAKARNLRKIGDVHQKKGNYDRTLEVLTEAKELVEEGTTEHSRILLGEGYPYWSKGDFDKALALFSEAIEVSENIGGEQKDLGTALRAVGNVHLDQGRQDEALLYYEKSRVVMENIGERYGMAAALNNIGAVYLYKGEMDMSLEFFERSLEIREKIGYKHGMAATMNNIGVIHRNKGEMTKALEFYERSLEMREKIGDKQGVENSSISIGLAYWQKGDMVKALEHLEHSLAIGENIGNKIGISTSLISIGRVYLYKGDFDRALEFYTDALEISLEIGDKHGTIYAYCGLAEVDLEQGNVQNALENAGKGIEISIEIEAKVEHGTILRVLGMIYRKVEDWDRAEEEFAKAKTILEEVGDKSELAKLSYEHAILFKAQNELDKAKECLEKSIMEFEAMGMELWADKCRKVLDSRSIR